MARTYLTNGHLLRPSLIGRLLRSFRLHSPRYARETIAASASMRAALATMPIHELGSGQDLTSAFTALFILGMIWLRTRMHYTRELRGPKRLSPAGRIYFAVVVAVLVLGWLLAPPVARALSPGASAPPVIVRFFWFMATYLIFIVVHRMLKARGVEVFKAAR